ncbi:DUF547 domain-containing protein [Maribacter aestuarii]|uniref:DUF547 domain-containing protein n=1 Tax=Maribacter aestuarii TaxID=1130723 RepID=UPI00248D1DD3|nr:DUF547 domain-containing protein [Maribacter aestuarii]
MKKLFALFFIGFISIVEAQHTDSYFAQTNAFLKENVKNGRVDYNSIKANPAPLKDLISQAKKLIVSKADAKTYQAFWINTYNLLVIDGIVENYPLKSPLDVPGFFDKKKHDVGGEQITLNDIENKLLRANFPKEARFHFVLVCAGLGCPPIIAMAYSPERLDAQLEQQTVKALNDPDFIKVNNTKIGVSQIFEWYKGDFEQYGSILDFINKYRKDKLSEDSKISYYPYDWTLNDMKN